MPIKLSIVEDDAGTRKLFVKWLDRAKGMQVISDFESAEAAIEKMPRNPPDVALVDINLPGRSGIECVALLKPHLPNTQFVMLTVYEDVDRVFEALAAGATGYMLKETPKAELVEAIQDVFSGGSPMTGHIARKVVRSFQRPVAVSPEVNLSVREQEVLNLLAQGYAYKEIVVKLGISRGSLNTYIRRVYEKLHVCSRGEAVAALRGSRPNPKP